MCFHEAEELMQSVEVGGDFYHDEISEEETYPIYLEAIDRFSEGLRVAEAQQNDMMRAKISAKLGHIYFKKLRKEEGEELKILRRAMNFYKKTR